MPTNSLNVTSLNLASSVKDFRIFGFAEVGYARFLMES
jgi:hypothetical protein